MRYRPFGTSGKAISSLSLLLSQSARAPTAQAWRSLIFTAMENGINGFDLTAGCDALDQGMAMALQAVERRLLFLVWRIRWDPRQRLSADTISQMVRYGVRRTGAGYFDLLMLEEEAVEAMEPAAREVLTELKSSGVALQIGVGGAGPAVEACIGSDPFDVISQPFDLTSDSRVRRRVKEAVEAGMTALAFNPAPAALLRAAPAPEGRKPSLFARAVSHPAAAAGPYAFLHETPGWAADEICLGYALTEPAFATVQMECLDVSIIERMAAVCDRDLPTGVAAQIEMARFSAEPAAEPVAPKRRA